jgi:hypothetical protein
MSRRYDIYITITVYIYRNDLVSSINTSGYLSRRPRDGSRCGVLRVKVHLISIKSRRDDIYITVTVDIYSND